MFGVAHANLGVTTENYLAEIVVNGLEHSLTQFVGRVVSFAFRESRNPLAIVYNRFISR